MKAIEWRQIQEFPEYEVSNEGTVRTWRRKSCTWRNPHSARRDTPVVLKGSVHPLGYVAFMLRKPGESKPHRRTAHRLVALAFLPNPKNLSDVAHNDGDPSNNRVENLRWSTHRDNQLDMRRHGTMQDGERCITAKLTERQALEIARRLAAEGRGAGVRIAKEYGISKAQVSRIKNGTRWQCLRDRT